MVLFKLRGVSFGARMDSKEDSKSPLKTYHNFKRSSLEVSIQVGQRQIAKYLLNGFPRISMVQEWNRFSNPSLPLCFEEFKAKRSERKAFAMQLKVTSLQQNADVSRLNFFSIK